MKTPEEIVDELTDEQSDQLYNDIWYDARRAEGWQLDEDSGSVQWAIDLGLIEPEYHLLTYLGMQVAGIVRNEDMIG